MSRKTVRMDQHQLSVMYGCTSQLQRCPLNIRLQWRVISAKALAEIMKRRNCKSHFLVIAIHGQLNI